MHLSEIQLQTAFAERRELVVDKQDLEDRGRPGCYSMNRVGLFILFRQQKRVFFNLHKSTGISRSRQ